MMSTLLYFVYLVNRLLLVFFLWWKTTTRTRRRAGAKATSGAKREASPISKIKILDCSVVSR